MGLCSIRGILDQGAKKRVWQQLYSVAVLNSIRKIAAKLT